MPGQAGMLLGAESSATDDDGETTLVGAAVCVVPA
jgi:hypothetical protein